VQQRLVERGEKVNPRDRLAIHRTRPGQPSQGTNPGGDVIKGRQMRQVTAIAAQQDRAAERIDAASSGQRALVQASQAVDLNPAVGPTHDQGAGKIFNL
jgi:hypothetical protein